MFGKNKSFNEIVLHSSGHDADLLRFCLSDKVPLSIDDIVRGDLVPLEYADKLMTTSYDLLYKNFFEATLKPLKLPLMLQRAIVFDDLLTIACLLRIMVIQPSSRLAVDQLMGKVRIFLLCTSDDCIRETIYSGLGNFELHAKEYVRTTSPEFESGDIRLIKPLIAAVSHMADRQWIFNDPHWRTTLMGKRSRLLALRGFLHVALWSFTMKDEHIVRVFDMTRSDVLSLVYEFVELRKSPKVKLSEVEDFVKRLGMYFNLLNIHTFFAAMLAGPFSFFEDLGRGSSGNTPSTPNRLNATSNRGN